MAPCLFCNKKMTRYAPETDALPKDGGDIQFIFCNGSRFHECSSVTQYSAIVCDDCAEKYLAKMKKTCELW